MEDNICFVLATLHALQWTLLARQNSGFVSECEQLKTATEDQGSEFKQRSI